MFESDSQRIEPAEQPVGSNQGRGDKVLFDNPMDVEVRLRMSDHMQRRSIGTIDEYRGRSQNEHGQRSGQEHRTLRVVESGSNAQP